MKRNIQREQAGKSKTRETAQKTKAKTGKVRNYYVNLPPVGISGYPIHGATDDKDLAWLCTTGSPRTDIDDAMPRLRARARDLFISSTLNSAAVTTRAAGAVGAGLRLDAQPDAQTLALDAAAADLYDRRIEAAWERWTERAGVDGRSLDEITQQIALACLMSGDCFVDVLISGQSMRLAVIESDRVETPTIMQADPRVIHGVHTNAAGRPIAYYVADAYAYDMPQLIEYTRKRAFGGGYYDTGEGRWVAPVGGILHAHMPFERPGQRRGIPAASRVLIDSKTLDRYKTAEVDAAAVAANAAMLITHPAEDITAEVDIADSFTATQPEGHTEPPAEVQHPGYVLKPGSVYHLEPGADVRSFKTDRPNTAFSAFCDAYDARICAAMGLPAEVVQRRYDSSYSASRAARLDADMTYRLDRARIISQVLRPIYRAWLDLNADRLGLDGYYLDATRRFAWQKADFLGESVPSIDPEKEVNAAIAAIEAGLSTRAREARLLNGMDTGTVIRVLASEEAQLRAAGLVKDQNGNPIQMEDER